MKNIQKGKVRIGFKVIEKSINRDKYHNVFPLIENN